MADDAVELVRHAFVPWRSGQLAEFAEFLAPELSWDTSAHPLPDFPVTGSGAEAFLRNMADYRAGWVDYEVSEIESFAVGNEVVFVCTERVAMRDTDVKIDRLMVVVWTVEGGRLTRFRIFDTPEGALAAIGAEPPAAAPS
jgi:ketosteroid isomerase-like protein